MSADANFWPPFGADPVINRIYRAARYRRSALPRTAIEFVDCLRELSQGVGDIHDLDLQNLDGPRNGHPFKGQVDEVVGVGVDDAFHGALDVERGPDGRARSVLQHENSSRCEGDGTPVRSSVEVAADSAAGSAGGPLAPSRPPFELDRIAGALERIADRLDQLYELQRLPDAWEFLTDCTRGDRPVEYWRNSVTGEIYPPHALDGLPDPVRNEGSVTGLGQVPSEIGNDNGALRDPDHPVVEARLDPNPGRPRALFEELYDHLHCIHIGCVVEDHRFGPGCLDGQCRGHESSPSAGSGTSSVGEPGAPAVEPTAAGAPTTTTSSGSGMSQGEEVSP